MLTAVFLVVYSFPYILKGHDVHIEIHDNLNQINMLGIFNGRFSADLLPSKDTPEYTLPGTPAIFHLAHLKLDKIFFRIGYFPGYIINELVIRIVALLGIFLLMNRWKLYHLSRFERLLISFSFAALPFWSQGNISVAGIPLVIYALLEAWQGRRFLTVSMILIGYGFYSNFFLTGIYVQIALIILMVGAAFRKKNYLWFLVLSLIFMTVAFLSHLPVFLNLIYYKLPTNRIAQDLTASGLIDRIKAMLFLLIRSSSMSRSYHCFLILPFTLAASGYFYFSGKEFIRPIKFSWSMIIMFTLLFGLFFFRPFYSFYRKLGTGYNFSRIYVLNTPFWYILWALCLARFKRFFLSRSSVRIMILVLIFAQLILNLSWHYHIRLTGRPSFSDFVSKDQFKQIRMVLEDRSIQDIRIGCIGFFPAVANYNGFRTVDSFSAYYPLEYKHRFREVIDTELAANPGLKEYFERRGSALFLFDDIIGRYYKNQEFIHENIYQIKCDLNLDRLKEIGAGYILSTVEIEDAPEKGLEKLYQSRGKYYRKIVVYEIL